MTSVPTSGPIKPVFADRTFYLDLRNTPSLRPKITFGITALKGTVEEFLSKDVKYLITDKPEKDWPPKPEVIPDSNNGEDSSQPTSNSNTVASPPITNSASLTTQNTATTKSTTTDVLEIASKRNVKIIAAKRMLEFLMTRVNIPGHPAAGSGENLFRGISMGESDFAPSRDKNKSIRAVKFKGPYIKVESCEQNTRPCWKVFQSWPDLLLDATSTGCPFKNTSQTAAALTAARVTAAAEKMNLTSSATAAKANLNGNLTTGNISGTLRHSNSLNGQKKGHHHTTNGQSATATNVSPLTNYNSPISNLTHQNSLQQASPLTPLGSFSRQPIPLTASATITASSIVPLQATGHRPATSKRRKLCDICLVEFSDLRGHLESYAHKSFTENEENFQVLADVVKLLPSLDDLICNANKEKAAIF